MFATYPSRMFGGVSTGAESSSFESTATLNAALNRTDAKIQPLAVKVVGPHPRLGADFELQFWSWYKGWVALYATYHDSIMFRAEVMSQIAAYDTDADNWRTKLIEKGVKFDTPVPVPVKPYDPLAASDASQWSFPWKTAAAVAAIGVLGYFALPLIVGAVVARPFKSGDKRYVEEIDLDAIRR